MNLLGYPFTYEGDVDGVQSGIRGIISPDDKRIYRVTIGLVKSEVAGKDIISALGESGSTRVVIEGPLSRGDKMLEFDYNGDIKGLREIVRSGGVLPDLTYSFFTPCLFSNMPGNNLPRELSEFDEGDLVRLVWPEIIPEINFSGREQ